MTFRTMALCAMIAAGMLVGCGDDESPIGETTVGNPAAWNLNEDGVALSGVSPVGIINRQQVLMGNPSIVYDWEGVKFYLLDEDEVRMMETSPESYAPKYGGWCAWEASQGNQVPGYPTIWDISFGRLVVFSSEQARAQWNEEARMGRRALMDRAQQWWDSVNQ